MLLFAPHTAVTDAHSISHLNALCSSDTTVTDIQVLSDRCYFNVVVVFILTTSQRNIHHISSFSGMDLKKFFNRILEMCFLAILSRAVKAQIAFPPKCPSPQLLKNHCVYSWSGSGCLNLLSAGWSRLLTNLSLDAVPGRCAISCFPSWLREHLSVYLWMSFFLYYCCFLSACS